MTACTTAKRSQEQIRQQTDAIAQQLADVLDDLALSGLTEAGDDHALSDIRGMLSSLSQKEMSDAIRLLQQARARPAGQAGQDVQAAHAKQLDAIATLRQMLTTYRQKQSIDRLAQDVARLAQRQAAMTKKLEGSAKRQQQRGMEPVDARLLKNEIEQQKQTAVEVQRVADALVALSKTTTDPAQREASEKAQTLLNTQQLPRETADVTNRLQAGQPALAREASAKAAEDLSRAGRGDASENSPARRDRARGRATE
ncbi:MAG: hypothetical protein QM770_11510 [Tepidisphaeraceae bacterium]